MEKSRIRKNGKTKRIISEWDNFWEDHSEFLMPPVSWEDARIETLHIAIALQEFEPTQIAKDLCFLKEKLKEYSIQYSGNLSAIFKTIKDHPEFIEQVEKTVFNKAVGVLMIMYHKVFNIEVPKGPLPIHKIIYKAYNESKDRHGDIPILIKYIISRFTTGLVPDAFGLLGDKKRQDILKPSIASQITPMYLAIVNFEHFIDKNFVSFVWYYNYKYLPFVTSEDLKMKESKNFKVSSIKTSNRTLNRYFEGIKKIELIDVFSRGVAEIMMGFIARQQYLFQKVIEQEERHEGEIAESTLRLLYENRLKFLWLITKKDGKALKQYREYKVGREAYFVEYMKGLTQKKKKQDNRLNQMSDQLKEAMQSEGIDEYKLAIEKGDAFELNIGQLAADLGDDEPIIYTSIYKRTSDIIHGNWRILEKYHLEKSINPAHDGLLRYSTTNDKHAGLLPSYLALLLSCSFLIKFLELHPTMLNKTKVLYKRIVALNEKLNEEFIVQFDTRGEKEIPGK